MAAADGGDGIWQEEDELIQDEDEDDELWRAAKMKQIKEEHRHRSKMTGLLTTAKSKVSCTFHNPFSVALSLGSKCCNMEKTFNRSFHKCNSSCFDLTSVTSQLSHVMFVVACLMNNRVLTHS